MGGALRGGGGSCEDGGELRGLTSALFDGEAMCDGGELRGFTCGLFDGEAIGDGGELRGFTCELFGDEAMGDGGELRGLTCGLFGDEAMGDGGAGVGVRGEGSCGPSTTIGVICVVRRRLKRGTGGAGGFSEEEQVYRLNMAISKSEVIWLIRGTSCRRAIVPWPRRFHRFKSEFRASAK